MNEPGKGLLESMDHNPPATDQALSDAEAKLGMVFPAQYKELMLTSNGAEGMIGESSYLAIWTIEEVIELNIDLNMAKYTPGLVYFASDGGAMAYAYDTRNDKRIVVIPYQTIDIEEAEPCGETFEEFLETLYNME